MLIASHTFTTWLAIIAGLWLLIWILFYKVKEEQKIWSLIIMVCLVLSFVISFFTPTLYTVNACNQYTEQVVLFPTTYKNQKLTYGSHTYIDNTSKEAITIESIIYWNVSEKNAQKAYDNDREINAGEFVTIPIHSIDYVFTSSPSTVSTKSDGEIKYELYCGSMREYENDDEASDFSASEE